MGCKGRNTLIGTDGSETDLGSKASVTVKPGVRFQVVYEVFHGWY